MWRRTARGGGYGKINVLLTNLIPFQKDTNFKMEDLVHFIADDQLSFRPNTSAMISKSIFGYFEIALSEVNIVY